MTSCRPIKVPTFDGGFFIDGINMRTVAWCVRQLDELWLEADVAGDDTDLPGIDGRLGEARTRTNTRHDLDLIVTGACTVSGDPYANDWIGLETNLAFLHDNVLTLPAGGDGSRLGDLIMPSGSHRYARVHVTPRLAIKEQRSANKVYTLTIDIAKGRFVA